MPNDSFKVDPAVYAQLSTIEDDIQAISSLFKDINSKMLKLDDSIWMGKEKDKIDKQYMPYLKKLDESTDIYLMKFVNNIRQSISEHQEADLANKQTASELREL